MARIFLLRQECWVPKSPEEVMSFFQQASNLQKVIPAWLRFRILTPLPLDLGLNARLEYRFGLYGFTFHWVSTITLWDPPRQFVDEQLSGPYKLWRHLHQFKSENGGTLIRDRIEYSMPLGLILDRLFVRRKLLAIFEYRKERMLELLSEDGQSEAVNCQDSEEAASG